MTRYELDFEQYESAVTVVTEIRNLLIQPFKPSDRSHGMIAITK